MIKKNLVLFLLILAACGDPKETVLIKTGNSSFNHITELDIFSLPGYRKEITLKFDKTSHDFAIQLDKDKFYYFDITYLKNGQKVGRGYTGNFFLSANSNTIFTLDTLLQDQQLLINNESELTRSYNRIKEFTYKTLKLQEKEISRLRKRQIEAVDRGADNELIDSFSHAIELSSYKFQRQFYNGQLDLLSREDPSLVTAFILNSFPQEQIWSHLDRCKELMSRLSDAEKRSVYALPLFEKLNKRQLFKTGDQIKSLYGKNPEGESIDMNLIKNADYTFIDFWASWCGPCIEQMPKLKRVVQTTAASKFQVVGISIDDKRNFWLNALKDIDVPWKNYSDMGGSDRNISTYKLSNVPYNYLVDRHGTIVSVNVEPDSVRRFLALNPGD